MTYHTGAPERAPAQRPRVESSTGGGGTAFLEETISTEILLLGCFPGGGPSAIAGASVTSPSAGGREKIKIRDRISNYFQETRRGEKKQQVVGVVPHKRSIVFPRRRRRRRRPRSSLRDCQKPAPPISSQIIAQRQLTNTAVDDGERCRQWCPAAGWEHRSTSRLSGAARIPLLWQAAVRDGVLCFVGVTGGGAGEAREVCPSRGEASLALAR